ncbi:WecB/TagA/CpsF family glycosyltransferase [Fulvimarina sp. 2208YS6-2-32]|uniref:WecB/TagA/CpsF family glycosyltransferase n=1 Tax=Fulvimarina uroteuthidis TaxID=3098149 RepID=A0ABU5I1Z1_9HYPH|nr:WecB/TagA/CpsF family glycosyltransferase [Fulvimarina sp. 2208YS6-2-32]MDY8108788.1 WecB/TagA/CpsF family glycosyltransferase [Fulvimarina sp. 2208YS6-2-32]
MKDSDHLSGLDDGRTRPGVAWADGAAPAAWQHDRFDVLGVPVSAIGPADGVRIVEAFVRHRVKTFVCVTGVHGVIECRDDEALLSIHRRAGMVTPDGMPLVWWARRNGLAHVSRVYGPSLMRALCARAGHNHLRHFFYGGGAGVAADLRLALIRETPGLNVVGTYEPPFRPLREAEAQAMVEAINRAAPDIVWVGLGTPKQERWMNAYRDRLEAPVLIGVGAAFDFLSGRQVQAPQILQRSGLEWAYRLCREPRRLGRRYLNIVPRFLTLAIVHHVRGDRSGGGPRGG